MPDLASLDLEARLKEMFSDDFSGDLLDIVRTAAKKTRDSYTFNDTDGAVDYLYKTGYRVLAKAIRSRARLPEIEELISSLGDDELDNGAIKALVANFISKGRWESSSSNTVLIGSLIAGSYPDDEISGDINANVIGAKDTTIRFFTSPVASADVDALREDILEAGDYANDFKEGVGRDRADALASARELDATTERYVFDSLEDEREARGLRDSLSSSTLDDAHRFPPSPPPSSPISPGRESKLEPAVVFGQRQMGLSDLVGLPLLSGQYHFSNFRAPGGFVCTRTSLDMCNMVVASGNQEREQDRDSARQRGNNAEGRQDKAEEGGALNLFKDFLKRLMSSGEEEDPYKGDDVVKRHIFGID